MSTSHRQRNLFNTKDDIIKVQKFEDEKEDVMAW
jgi:hypothetical protein